MTQIDRCDTCQHKYHCIIGDGPVPCRIMCLGERPGQSEELLAKSGQGIGQVFIGDAGKEFNNHYLPLAGLDRGEDVYTSNVVKCGADNNRTPTIKEIQCCSAKFIPDELDLHRPEIVVLMGGSACSLVPGIDLETHHGIIRRAELFGKSYWVFPTYHPAAGMHNTSLMTQLMDDFTALRKILGGEYNTPVDKFPERQYLDLTGDREAIEYFLRADLEGPHATGAVAVDTETIPVPGDKYFPWCLTFSGHPGNGYMIRMEDREGIRYFGQLIEDYLIILHNRLFDLDILHKMNIEIPNHIDTMQMAYHQADLPRGLKPLCYRLAGMEMRDFEEVVMPHSRNVVVGWLKEAQLIASKIPAKKPVTKSYKIPKTPKAYETFRTKMEALIQQTGAYPDEANGRLSFSYFEDVPSKLYKSLERIHTHTTKPLKQGGTAYSPWKVWKELKEENEESIFTIESKIGDMPVASIAQVPLDEAIHYACEDADGTQRIFPILDQRAHKYSNIVAPRDIDIWP